MPGLSQLTRPSRSALGGRRSLQVKAPCMGPDRALALRAPSPSLHHARKEPLRDPGAERQVRSLSLLDARWILLLYFLIILLFPQGARVPFCCRSGGLCAWWFSLLGLCLPAHPRSR